jgi:polyketide synthase PksL
MPDAMKDLFALIRDGEIGDDEARERLWAAASLFERHFPAAHPWFRDHVVSDRPVLPGAVLIDQAIAAFGRNMPSDRKVYTLTQVGFVAPLSPRPDGAATVAVTLDARKYVTGSANPSRKSDFIVTSGSGGPILATGRIEAVADSDWLTPLVAPGDVRDVSPLDGFDAVYGLSDNVTWGDHFRTLTSLAHADGYVSSRFAMDAEGPFGDCLDPRIINSAFLSALAVFPTLDLLDDYLPISIRSLTCDCDATAADARADVVVTVCSRDLVSFDADIRSVEGRPMAAIRGFTLKRVSGQARPDTPPVAETIGSAVGPVGDALETWLSEAIRRHVPARPGRLSRRKNFMDLGVKSASLMAVVSELETDFDLTLNPTLLFEYPNLESLARFLRDEYPELDDGLKGRAEVAPPVTTETATAPSPKTRAAAGQRGQIDEHSIAIIGMDGRFAGADTIDQFWQNLLDETDLIRAVPRNHWDIRPWFDPDPRASDMTYCKWGTFIEDVDLFDAGFFNISPREARWMDPQLRLLLECAYHAIEDAGVINAVRGSDTGVFVGACFHDYSAKMTALGLPMDPYMGTGNSHTVLANRLSFLLDLNGPSIAYDTACSSSLVALHAACVALRNRECAMAIVGGTNLLLDSAHYRYFSSLRALSPTGRCHAFDAKADGYVPGECVGSVILKPLLAALRDNDRVHAIIRGSATSHGGYTPSLTAPSVDGEANVILKAWDDARIDPRDIGYIEAHGTGTPLGDPIEMTSLAKAFRKHTRDTGFCAVGTAKANIGHAEGAAGIAGLIKAVMQIRKGIIPRLASLSTVNPAIRLEGSALRIGDTAEHWPAEPSRLRTAGISSFGFSGAYAHVVVQEFPAPVDRQRDQGIAEAGPELILLSARSCTALRAQAKNLAEWLSRGDAPRLCDIAFSLQTGREAFDHRLALVVASVQELSAALRQFGEDRSALDGIAGGIALARLVPGRIALSRVDDDDAPVSGKPVPTEGLTVNAPDWPAFGVEWLRGGAVDWRALRSGTGTRPAMLDLPRYPFERISYWLDEDRVDSAPAQGGPLTFSFRPEDAFLADHRLRGVPVLPGVVYLDMLAQSVLHSVDPGTTRSDVIHASGLRWRRPMQVNAPVTVRCDLEPGADTSMLLRVTDAATGTDASAGPYFEAQLIDTTAQAPVPLDVTAMMRDLDRRDDLVAECARRFAAVGLHHGPSMSALKEVWIGAEGLLARLELPGAMPKPRMLLHPAAADGALQAIMALSAAEQATPFHGELRVPVGAEALLLSVAAMRVLAEEAPGASCWVRCAAVDTPATRYDVSLHSASGLHLMTLRRLTVETVGRDGSLSRAVTPVPRDLVAVPGPDGALDAFVQDLLVQTLAAEAQIDPATVDPALRLERYGIDSVMITGMAGRLETQLGPVSRAAFFESDTLIDLKDHFLSAHAAQLRALFGEGRGDVTRQPAPPQVVSPGTRSAVPDGQPHRQVPDPNTGTLPIAIIGIAGSYAGARDLDSLWENLKNGRDSISRLPESRWNSAGVEDGHAGILGGFVEGAAEFDARFFGIAPKDAPYFDPQERLFLQTAYHTLEDAGYTAESLSGRTVGVLVGVMYGEYQLYTCKANGGDVAIGGVAGSIANRISYTFNFSGLSMTLDSMCSSSITAIHIACQAIASGELDLALTGGVNLSVHPNKYRFLKQGQFLASDGRCRSFGDGGDGYVPGEGVGAVLLKRLDQAIADRDNIHGVILGTAVNHGGRTHGFSVPSPRAQADVAAEALARAGVPARSVNYIETHGTGTALGDPIEIHGLRKVYGGASPHRVAIGSIKSNIGHCESAAGIAGLTKVLLQMRNRTLVPSLHAAPPNPAIDFAGAGFRVNESLTDWPAPPADDADARMRPGTRRAALSSFGAGGSNAHMIVENHVPPVPNGAAACDPRLPVPIFLSARTADQLRSVAGGLRDRLRQARLAGETGFGLHDVAFTLCAGRTPMRHRWAAIAASLEELEARLSIWLDGDADAPDWHMPEAAVDRDLTTSLTAAAKDAADLCEQWVGGTDIQWSEVAERFFIMEQPRRVSLPGYPFERQTYWVSEPQADRETPAAIRAAPPTEAAESRVLLFREAWREAPLHGTSAPAATLSVLVHTGRGKATHAGPQETVHEIVLDPGAPQTQMLHAFLDEVPAILARLSDLQRSQPDGTARLQVVLSGAEIVVRLGHLNGFVASISQEAGGFFWRVVRRFEDAGAGDLRGDLKRLAQATWNGLFDLDHGRCRQMTWDAIADDRPQVAPWREGGVYVISGGAGGIGLIMAQEIVDCLDHCRVYLLGRSAPSGELRDRIDRMGSRTAQVFHEKVDCADEHAVAGFLATLTARGQRVRGIIHSAGVLRDAYFANRKDTDLDEVLAPKLGGMEALARASAGLDLDFLVAFSSIAQAFGNAGQSLYALANGAMDGVVDRHAASGCRCLSIAWPYWAEGGMALSQERIASLRGETGMSPLSTRDGIDAFYRALMQADTPLVLVLNGDPARIRSTLIPSVSDAPPGPAPAPTAVPAPFRAATVAVAQDVRDRWVDTIKGTLAALVADQLGLPLHEVGMSDVLIDLGYDSVSLAALATRLHKTFGISVQPTLFYEHRTITTLSTYLVSQYFDQVRAHYGEPVAEAPARRSASAPAETRAPVEDPARKAPAANCVSGGNTTRPRRRDSHEPGEPIAVVGISCTFPKSADLAAFWARLRDGDNCITETPADRWDWRTLDPASGSEYLRWGGFIDGLDLFDAAFFRISGREATLMEPSQRLLMTHVWKAIEDAGYAPGSLAGSRTALLVGTGQSGYADAGLRDMADIEGYSATGAVASVGPNRVSYFLDLKGPSEPVETACSSSLVAIHRAIGLLRSGEVDVALAGGVNTLPTPTMHVAFNKSGMLSPDGSCKAFSANANGYVRAEGVGLLMLKRLSDARSDGDHVYGLLRGSAQNHGGRSSSLTAPNPAAQADLLQAAYADAGIDASSVGYIEAHGTGTPLGDPIEMNGLQTGFARLGVTRAGGGDVVVGSVKSNIGHAELASGVAGVIKVLLQMRHQTIVRTLHADAVNPHITLGDTGFRIAHAPETWIRKRDAQGRELPLRAGVSSFGFGGVNAHVVLEEFVEEDRRAAAPSVAYASPAMIVLSARSDDQLREQARALADALSETAPDEPADPAQERQWLHDVAFTLQVGRDAMKSRLGLLAESSATLIRRLRQVAAGQTDVPEACFGSKTVSSDLATMFETEAELGDVLVRMAENGKQYRLLQLWANGVDFEWSRLSVNRGRRRLSLPGYAFRPECHWLPQFIPVHGTVPHDVEAVPKTRATPVAEDRDQPDLKALLVSLVARIMHLDDSVVATNVSLEEFGFDSISLTEFANALNDRLGLAVDPTLFFEHISIDALTAYLQDTLQGRWTPAAHPAMAAAAIAPDPVVSVRPGAPRLAHSGAPEPIAVVGMSVCLPGARDLDAYWENLVNGRDCITEVPINRWDWRAIYGDQRREPGRTNIKWGGFMEGIAEFDPLFFNIAPREAAQMDPQHRLLMTHCWSAIEDAGYSADTISGTNTGVFLATSMSNGYTEISLKAGAELESHTATGIISSVGPNRISYFLNLTGPSEPVETACSSSLVALHRAVAAIRDGECDMALVGGVNTMSNAAGHIAFSKAGMLSERGRCRSFSSGADGYVRGEGVGVVFIKRRAQAERDGDRIYGLIRGSALNHGGRASSFTAPNPAAQSDLIAKALRNAAVDPETVTYIEAHGTGTPLGDPIEIEGLKRAFVGSEDRAGGPREKTCAIGSVKSNIGHLELSAGVAGLAKVLLQLQHKTIVKGVYDTDYNLRCDLSDSPFYFAEKLQPWAALIDRQGHEIPRRAGVSSFGFGGVNAHVVVEEYIGVTPAVAESAVRPFPHAFVLSAKTQEQLLSYAQRWCDAIDRGLVSDQTHRLIDILYVAQTGRRPMEHRLGFRVDSIAGIRDMLARITCAEDLARGPWLYGKIKRGRTAQLGGFGTVEERNRQLEQWLADDVLPEILDRWVLGMAVDWEQAFDISAVRRARIPTYPFARTRYWIGDPDSAVASIGDDPAPPTPAPSRATSDRPLVELIPMNTGAGDPSDSTFRWLLDGADRYVRDHVVQGRQILPGVLVLEVVTSALDRLGRLDPARMVCIRNVTWVRPIIHDKGRPVVGVVLTPVGPDEWRFRLEDLDNTRAGPFSQGVVSLEHVLADQPPQVQPLAPASRNAVAPSALYALFDAAGLAYGPAHRAITAMQVRVGEVVAQLAIPQDADCTGRSWHLHPSLLDCALQASSGLYFPDGLTADAPAQLVLPFGLDEVQVLGTCPDVVEARASFSTGNASDAAVRKADIDLFDLQGRLCVRIKGFSSRVLPATDTPSRDVVILGKSRVTTDLPGPGSAQEGADLVLVAIGFDRNEMAPYVSADAGRETRLVILHDSAPNSDTGQHFTHYATGLADVVREILAGLKERGASANRCLVRLVCRADCDRRLEGLAALLRSAQRESGKLLTQFVTTDKAQLARLEDIPVDPSLPCQEIDLSGPVALVPVWTRLGTDGAKPSNSPWRAGGRYLVTGGGGQLGYLTALHVARRAANPVLILTGRSRPDDRLNAMLDDIRSRGAMVEYVTVDITDASAVADLIARIQHDHGALHGVIHSAGVLDDALLINKDTEGFRRTLSPKVSGLVALDRALRLEPLDLFVTFSSIAGVFGNAGQSDYAAANAFMDDYMAARATMVASGTSHGVSVSLCWPYWESGGMHMNETAQAAVRLATGMHPLKTSRGFDALDRVLAMGDGVYTVLAGQGGTFDRLVNTLTARPGEAAPAPVPVLKRQSAPPLAIDGDDLAAHVERLLKDRISKLLAVDVEEIDPEVPLNEFGFDSITLTDFATSMGDEFGLALSPTVLFEHPTIDALAGYLADEYPQVFLDKLGGTLPKAGKLATPAPQPQPEEPAPQPRMHAVVPDRTGAAPDLPSADRGAGGSARAPCRRGVAGYAHRRPRHPGDHDHRPRFDA